MIGQNKLISGIDKIDKYPKFSIITGAKGSGKKEICKYICHKFNLPIVNFGVGIDEVRNIITLSYQQTKPVCYICSDADGMSIGAKNSLLKITEEPPNNAYFILTLVSLNNTLGTIQSRATILKLDNYSKEDILNYRKYRRYNDSHDNIVLKICETTGEVDELFKTDIPSFYSYVKSLFDYIHVVNSGNIFKITKSLKLKDGDTGFDPILVFKLLRNMYIEEGKNKKDKRYLMASNITTKCLQDLKLSTVSKQGTVDNWIFEVRKVLNARNN